MALLAVSAGALQAQYVDAAMSALTPLPVSTSAGGLPSVTTFPAGPMAPNGILSSSTGGLDVSANLQWITTSDELGTQVAFYTFLTNGVATGVGQVGPLEILVRFTALQPTQSYLQVTRNSLVALGAPWPAVQLDFGNDGSIDYVANDGVSAFAAPNLGSQVFDVRVIMNTSLAGIGSTSVGLSLSMMPDNSVQVQPLIAGCDLSGTYLVAPTFVDRGLKLSAATSDPCVHVVGLSVTPLLLLATTLPCVLLPTPDLLLFSPTQVVALPLPAGVRPVTFHAQGVVLSPIGVLKTLEGFTVSAF